MEFCHDLFNLLKKTRKSKQRLDFARLSLRDILRKTGNSECNTKGTFPEEMFHSIAIVLRSYDI